MTDVVTPIAEEKEAGGREEEISSEESATTGDETKVTKIKTVKDTWKTIDVIGLLATLIVLVVLAFIGVVILAGFLGSLWIQYSNNSNNNNNENLQVQSLTASGPVTAGTLASRGNLDIQADIEAANVESLNGLYGQFLTLTNQGYVFFTNLAEFAVDNNGSPTLLPMSNINQDTMIWQGDGASLEPTTGIFTFSQVSMWVFVAMVKWVASSSTSGTAPDVGIKGVLMNGNQSTSTGSSYIAIEQPWETLRNTQAYIVQPLQVTDATVPQYWSIQAYNRTGVTQTISNVVLYCFRVC